MRVYKGKEYYRAAELAKFLPVNEYTIRQWVKDARIIPDLMVGNRMFFLQASIEAMIVIK